MPANPHDLRRNEMELFNGKPPANGAIRGKVAIRGLLIQNRFIEAWAEGRKIGLSASDMGAIAASACKKLVNSTEVKIAGKDFRGALLDNERAKSIDYQFEFRLLLPYVQSERLEKLIPWASGLEDN